ncbi:MAG TPA: endospore germination permease [Tissierellales bacterium]|nr:endospore germination permease [Tissierellales bacterium]
MKGKSKVSNRQIKALIVSVVIGIGILSLPSDLAEIVENGGWFSIILGGILTIPIIMIFNSLNLMYPGKIYFEFGKEIVPPFIFNIMSFIFLVYLVGILTFSVRIFGAVIKVFLLETTPIGIIIITMLWVTSYLGRSKIVDISRMALIIYPIILVTAVGVVIFSIPGTDFSNIHPLANIKLKPMLRSIPIAFFAYGGYEIGLIAMGNVEKPEESLKYSIYAIVDILIIYLLFFFITLSQFGINELKRQIWPSLVLTREIGFPGLFIENLDGIVMAIWVVVIFGTMGPAFHVSGIILSNLFNTKKHDYFVTALIPIVYIISILPQNLRDVYKYMGKFVNITGVISAVIFPIILFVINKVKNRREKL